MLFKSNEHKHTPHFVNVVTGETAIFQKTIARPFLFQDPQFQFKKISLYLCLESQRLMTTIISISGIHSFLFSLKYSSEATSHTFRYHQTFALHCFAIDKTSQMQAGCLPENSGLPPKPSLYPSKSSLR